MKLFETEGERIERIKETVIETRDIDIEER